jgi:hypothetical protein
MSSEPKLLHTFKTKNGYIAINLYRKHARGDSYNAKHLYIVAHLILLTYGPPKPSPKHKVRYIDGDRTNISLSNLVWISKEEIMRTIINKIKKTMKRRERKQIIIVVDGQNNASDMIKDSVIKLIDKNEEKRKKRPYLVFSPEGYEEWKTKGYIDPRNIDAEYRDEIIR